MFAICALGLLLVAGCGAGGASGDPDAREGKLRVEAARADKAFTDLERILNRTLAGTIQHPIARFETCGVDVRNTSKVEYTAGAGYRVDGMPSEDELQEIRYGLTHRGWAVSNSTGQILISGHGIDGGIVLDDRYMNFNAGSSCQSVDSSVGARLVKETRR